MEEVSLKIGAILMVDMYSRLNCSIDIAELRRFGVDLIADFKEIFEQDYENKPIIILEGCLKARNGLTDLVLYKTLMNLNYIFIGSDKVIIEEMRDHARIFEMKTDVINYNLIAAVVNDDAEAKSIFMIQPTDRIAKLAQLIADNNTLDPGIRDVARAYITTGLEYLALVDDYRDVKSRLEIATTSNDNKDEQIQTLSKVLDEMLRQTIRVNDCIRQYEFICAKDVYNKVNLATFQNKPNIIYFKEFNEFLMLKSFIYTLAEVLKVQFAAPVKVLWVLDTKTPLRGKSIPEYYKTFFNGIFNKPDIHAYDYLCTHNGYEGILNVLCENQSATEFLIIVDSKLADDTIISMQDVLRYDLCRDYKKLNLYELNPDRTIVNGMGDIFDLSWDYIEEYDELDDSDRFLYLSGRPVIQSILRTINSVFGA